MIEQEFEQQLYKIADGLEDLGLYKEASEVDGMVKEAGVWGTIKEKVNLAKDVGVAFLTEQIVVRFWRYFWSKFFTSKAGQRVLEQMAVVKPSQSGVPMLVSDWEEMASEANVAEQYLYRQQWFRNMVSDMVQKAHPDVFGMLKSTGVKVNLARYDDKVAKIFEGLSLDLSRNSA